LSLRYSPRYSQYDEAEAAYHRALKALEKNVGTNDPKTANTYHNLGMVLQLKGDIQGAVAYFEKDVNIMTTILGASHPDTLSSVKHLVRILEHKPIFKAKIAKYQQLATRGEMKAHGEGSLEYLEAVNQAAENQIDSGHSAEAALALQDAIKSFQGRTKGKSEATDAMNAVLVCLNNVGVALMMEDDLTGAINAFQQCATGYASSPEYGPQHVSTVMVMNNLGMLFAAQSRTQEAEGCYRRALRGIEPFFSQSKQERDHRKFLIEASRRTSTLGGARGSSKGISLKTPEEIAELEEAANTLRSNLGIIVISLDEKVALFTTVLDSTERKIDAKKYPTHPELVVSMQNLAAALAKKCHAEGPEVTAGTRAKTLTLAKRLIGAYKRKKKEYSGELKVFQDLIATLS